MATTLLPTTLRASLDLAAMVTSPTHALPTHSDGEDQGPDVGTEVGTGSVDSEEVGLARLRTLVGKHSTRGDAASAGHTAASEDEGGVWQRQNTAHTHSHSRF